MFDIQQLLQIELMSSMTTGNVLIDSVFRTLGMTLLMSIFAWLSDYGSGLVCASKSMWDVLIRKKEYSVKLEGHSSVNNYMNERFVFSVEFKAILDYILTKKCLDESCTDVHSLTQFNTDLDVKYDYKSDSSSREYLHSYILNQPSDLQLTDDGIYAHVKVEESGHDDDSSKSSKSITTKTYVITLRSSRVTCDGIVKWIDAITTEYKEARAKRLASDRYFVRFRGFDSELGSVKWDSDVLASDPSFDSLFFEGKDEFMATVNRFLEERKFYESVGKPWQLGINLSGPPGCGKTSFIRVLAAVLNRNVKDISFSKMKTNKDFEEAIRCVEYNGMSLASDRTIIVAEDIDCSNLDVIRARKSAKEDIDMQQVEQGDLDADGSDDDDESSKKGSNEVGALVSAMKEMSRIDKACVVASEKAMKIKEDLLDLSTILNVMDGVTSADGRIIVFTSNHPEKVDPALLRPGRIDLDVRLGPLPIELVFDMAKHWYTKYAEFYDQPELLTEFLDAWTMYCEGVLVTRSLRPCVIHNVLQKHGKNIESAMKMLASLKDVY